MREVDTKIKIMPLFPLEQVVLFPRALLSVQMPTANQILGLGEYITLDAEICLGLLKNHKSELQGKVAKENDVYHIACVGRIINKEPQGKNGFKFLLEGTERARIIEHIRQRPVVMVKVEILNDYIDIDQKADLQAEMKELLRLLQNLGEMLPHFRPIIKSITATYPHPAIVADLIAYTFIKDTYAKLSILSELNALRRLKLVAVQLRNISAQLSRQHQQNE